MFKAGLLVVSCRVVSCHHPSPLFSFFFPCAQHQKLLQMEVERDLAPLRRLGTTPASRGAAGSSGPVSPGGRLPSAGTLVWFTAEKEQVAVKIISVESYVQ